MNDKILFYKYFYSKNISELENLLNKNISVIDFYDKYKLINFILINDWNECIDLFRKFSIDLDNIYIDKYKIIYNCKNIL
jgi:hypothetical protein